MFLYYDVSPEEAADQTKWTKKILTERMGKGYVIQIFSLMNGKIDFFSDLPEEKRGGMSYFNSLIKDLPNEEIQAFLKKKPGIKNRM